MTVPIIPNSDRIADYTATAGQTDFAVPWPVIADSTVLAVNDMVAEVNGVAVNPSLTTFAGNVITGLDGMWNGGTLTIPACQGGERVVIYSARAPRRTGSFLEGATLPFSELDKLQDDIIVQVRDLALRVGRSLKVSVEDYLDGFDTDTVIADIEANATAAQAAATNAIAASSAVSGAVVYSTGWVLSTKTAPVGGETEGTRYLVASVGATGAFTGKGNNVAQLVSGTWVFAAPGEGQRIFNQAERSVYVYTAAGTWNIERVFAAPGDNLQTAFTKAAGAMLTILAGTYTGVGVVVPSNIQIQTLGKVTLQTTSTTVPILDFTNAVNVTMRGNWKLQGNGANNSGTPLSGAINSGQVGMLLYNSVGVDIDGYIEICNIKGYGIDEQAPASTFRVPGLNSFRGLRVHDCYFGAFVRNFAEYSNYSNSWFYNNIAGVRDESGNRGYHQCHFIDNNYGVFLDGSVEPGNNSHGLVSGCFINHNQTNIVCDTTQLGMLFTGCQILSEQSGSGHGVISIINGARLINFVGCDIGSDVTIDATSQASFVGNTIRSTLANAPTVTAGGVITGSGNVDENGVNAFLWNAMNSWTPVLKLGGATGSITYSYQNARYAIKDGFLHYWGQITLTSKAGATGAATISGLPKNAGTVPPSTPGTFTGNNLDASVAKFEGEVAASGSVIQLYKFAAGAQVALNDTDLTNTSVIKFSGSYPLG